METNAGQTGYKKAGRLLQDGAALVPIEDYAAREGVSLEVIEACGQAGIVQIRRHKGKIFVVDIPLTPYFQQANETEGNQQATGRVVKTTVTTEPPQERRTSPSNAVENKMPKPSGQTIKAGSIANLARKMYLKARQIMSRAQQPAAQFPEKQSR
jgi:hypothetical protein